MVLPYSNVSKRCTQNGKQYRSWSDSSFRNSRIWVYTDLPTLSVRKFKIITRVDFHHGPFCEFRKLIIFFWHSCKNWMVFFCFIEIWTHKKKWSARCMMRKALMQKSALWFFPSYFYERKKNQLSNFIINFSCSIFILNFFLSEVFLCYCSKLSSQNFAEEFCSCCYS